MEDAEALKDLIIPKDQRDHADGRKAALSDQVEKTIEKIKEREGKK